MADLIVLDRQGIESIIPHRGPMLFADCIIRTDDGQLQGVFRPMATDWFYDGHFPGNPVTPMCIMLEAAAQLGLAIIIQSRWPATPVDVLATEGRIKMTARTPVKPGEKLIAKLKGEPEVREIRSSFYVNGNVELFVDDKRVVDTTITGWVTPKK